MFYIVYKKFQSKHCKVISHNVNRIYVFFFIIAEIVIITQDEGVGMGLANAFVFL